MEGYLTTDGRYYEGDRQRTDQIVPIRPSPFHAWNNTLSTWEEDLTNAKRVAYERVIIAVGDARLRYVVSTATQSGTYIDKAKEAEAYKTAGYPLPLDTTLYPYIDGSSRARGLTAAQAADYILGEYSRLRALNGRQVEYIREQASVHIEAATTLAEIESIKTRAINALLAV